MHTATWIPYEQLINKINHIAISNSQPSVLYHQANLGAANSANSTQNDPSTLDPTKQLFNMKCYQ